MTTYQPALRDLQFVLHEQFNVQQHYQSIPSYADVDLDTVTQILEEAGKFCSEVIHPLNAVGDVEGCKHDPATHAVQTPKGFKEAYAQFVAAGWPSLSCDANYGGQGLPPSLNQVLYEMLNAANQAWAMYPGLTHGAYDCLREHGTESLKQQYLPALSSGAWTGTMCLTEPHCGTDLGLLRTKAVPNVVGGVHDGSYLLTGNKIFISAGEHDLAENIIHLVLARLPDAPLGTKGISLFLVPKILPNADGTLGARNAMSCGAIEHKMGIHGNATCQINLDGAQGWLIGQPNRGLQAMFVMMNAARLGVGLQSLGLTEVAYQNAAQYAKDRLQGRALTGPKAPEKAADPIVVHPDVRRMLLTMRAYAEGGRALAVWAAMELDKEHHPDEAVRQAAHDRLALLTPVCKAFLTDNGFASTSMAVQVLGGHGYIREWGLEQMVRDSRINMIYEGTNAIQSLDLLGRKVLANSGVHLSQIGDEVKTFCMQYGQTPGMAEFTQPLLELSEKLQKLTMELGFKAMGNADEVGAAAVDYLRVVGHWLFAYLFAQQAHIALKQQATGDVFYSAKLHVIRFYFAKLLPETAALMRSARAGAATLMDMPAEWF